MSNIFLLAKHIYSSSALSLVYRLEQKLYRQSLRDTNKTQNSSYKLFRPIRQNEQLRTIANSLISSITKSVQNFFQRTIHTLTYIEKCWQYLGLQVWILQQGFKLSFIQNRTRQSYLVNIEQAIGTHEKIKLRKQKSLIPKTYKITTKNERRKLANL